MAAVAGADDRAPGFKAYVNNMAAGTTEEQLAALFKDCGSIVRTTVLRRDNTKGLVVFESEASLPAAVGLNGADLNGAKIEVTDQRPPRGSLPRREPNECRIYVENFPEGTTDDELAAHFASCGTVTDSRVIRSGTHGFVTFESVASVDAALAQDGSDMGGNKITVTKEADMPKRPRRRRKRAAGGGSKGGAGSAPREPRERATDPPNPARLWVGGIDKEVTKDDVLAFFGAENVESMRLRGRFALVLMTSPDKAEEALAYSGEKIAGRVVEVAKSSLPESAAKGRRSGRRSGRRRRPAERSDEPANPARVFVGHIPKEFTEDDVRAIFGAGVEEVVLRGRYGYVLFGSEAAASAALAKNGTEVAGDAIIVEKSTVPDDAIYRRRRRDGPREE